MGTLRLNGSSSGYIEISAPAAAGSTTITLPATSGGNFLVTDSSGNLNVDSGTLYVDATNNRVGIGTSSPADLLNLSGGNLRLSGLSNNQGILLVSSDPSSRLEVVDGGSTWAIQTQDNLAPLLINASTLSLQTSGGRVGIGTTSPSANLHVESTSEAKFILKRANPFGSTLEIKATGDGIAGAAMFSLDSTERMRIDGAGRLLVGTSSAYGSAIIQAVGYAGSAANTGYVSIIHGGNATSGEDVGLLEFRDTRGAFGSIKLAVDGTTGTNDYPGRLVFSTTADGSSSPTERMRIINSGFLKVANDGDYASASATYHELNNTTNEATLLIRAKNASLSTFNIRTGCYRAANSAWSVLRAESGDGSTNAFNDIEFNLRGDGNAYADGSWNGGGADYAEYFEWSDGNPDEEDRRGISVVLDGDKIRPAIDGEDPIGVISGNPSVVGDAAWNKWSGKYLRDDYGTYIQEDYEVANDEGETVIQQRRKLNPAYDPDQEYINREQRPEWDCVGLMGKLRIRKGQPTGSRWIKMRDISDSVEEWLVR